MTVIYPTEWPKEAQHALRKQRQKGGQQCPPGQPPWWRFLAALTVRKVVAAVVGIYLAGSAIGATLRGDTLEMLVTAIVLFVALGIAVRRYG